MQRAQCPRASRTPGAKVAIQVSSLPADDSFVFQRAMPHGGGAGGPVSTPAGTASPPQHNEGGSLLPFMVGNDPSAVLCHTLRYVGRLKLITLCMGVLATLGALIDFSYARTWWEHSRDVGAVISQNGTLAQHESLTAHKWGDSGTSLIFWYASLHHAWVGAAASFGIAPLMWLQLSGGRCLRWDRACALGASGFLLGALVWCSYLALFATLNPEEDNTGPRLVFLAMAFLAQAVPGVLAARSSAVTSAGILLAPACFSAFTSIVTIAVGFVIMTVLLPMFSASGAATRILIRVVLLPIFAEIPLALIRVASKLSFTGRLPTDRTLIPAVVTMTYIAVAGRVLSTNMVTVGDTVMVSLLLGVLEVGTRFTMLQREQLYTRCCISSHMCPSVSMSARSVPPRAQVKTWFAYMHLDSAAEDMGILISLFVALLFRVPPVPGGTPLTPADAILRVALQYFVELLTELSFALLYFTCVKACGVRYAPVPTSAVAARFSRSGPGRTPDRTLSLSPRHSPAMAPGSVLSLSTGGFGGGSFLPGSGGGSAVGPKYPGGGTLILDDSQAAHPATVTATTSPSLPIGRGPSPIGSLGSLPSASPGLAPGSPPGGGAPIRVGGLPVPLPGGLVSGGRSSSFSRYNSSPGPSSVGGAGSSVFLPPMRVGQGGPTPRSGGPTARSAGPTARSAGPMGRSPTGGSGSNPPSDPASTNRSSTLNSGTVGAGHEVSTLPAVSLGSGLLLGSSDTPLGPPVGPSMGPALISVGSQPAMVSPGGAFGLPDAQRSTSLGAGGPTGVGGGERLDRTLSGDGRIASPLPSTSPTSSETGGPGADAFPSPRPGNTWGSEGHSIGLPPKGADGGTDGGTWDETLVPGASSPLPRTTIPLSPGYNPATFAPPPQPAPKVSAWGYFWTWSTWSIDGEHPAVVQALREARGQMAKERAWQGEALWEPVPLGTLLSLSHLEEMAMGPGMPEHQSEHHAAPVRAVSFEEGTGSPGAPPSFRSFHSSGGGSRVSSGGGGSRTSGPIDRRGRGLARPVPGQRSGSLGSRHEGSMQSTGAAVVQNTEGMLFTVPVAVKAAALPQLQPPPLHWASRLALLTAMGAELFAVRLVRSWNTRFSMWNAVVLYSAFGGSMFLMRSLVGENLCPFGDPDAPADWRFDFCSPP